MLIRKAKQYNLRSSKQGQVHMPIHKQLCDDREFLTEMLGEQSDPVIVLSKIRMFLFWTVT